MITSPPRITIDASVCHGKPCIRGLRYPVENVLEWLAAGMDIGDILAEPMAVHGIGIGSEADRAERVRELLALVQPDSRYLDIAMRWRRLTGVFTAPMTKGSKVYAPGPDGAVELEVLASAPAGEPVPVASTTRRAGNATASSVTSRPMRKGDS